MRQRFAAWSMGLVAGAAGLALAQDASLAQYEGADRMERVVAAAKKEGTLTLYTTIAEKDLPVIVKPFEQKYGIKVNVWRAGTDKVLQRTVTENQAKKYEVDAIHFGSPEMEALSREKILLPVVTNGEIPGIGTSFDANVQVYSPVPCRIIGAPYVGEFSGVPPTGRSQR